MDSNKVSLKENKFNLPWVEKYRPKILENVIGQDKIVDSLKNLFENGSFPHLLFYGGSGSGKTSTILSIINEYFGKKKKLMVMRLDASDDRGINSVRDEIKAFAEKKNYFISGIKVIILDEADSMTFDAQFALRRIIEKYSSNTRFCLICNYENKIIPAIKSRCAEFKFNSISNDKVKERLNYICNCEELKIDKKIIDTLSIISKGDMRKAINILQTISLCDKKSQSSKLCYSLSGFPTREEIVNLFNILIDSDIKFDKALASAKTLVSKNGYSVSMILKEVCEILVDLISNKDISKSLISKKSNYKIKTNLFYEGVDDDLDNCTAESKLYRVTADPDLTDNGSSICIPNYIKIFSELSNLENMVVKSTFGDIYLSTLVAIFKKIDWKNN